MSGKRKRRTLYAAGGIGALIALLFYNCPGGLGLGLGSGNAEQSETTSAESADAATDEQAPDAREVIPPAQRCKLRLDKTGITLNGEPTDLDAAVAACQKAGAADLIVTGDANHGFYVATKEALDDAGVEVYQR